MRSFLDKLPSFYRWSFSPFMSSRHSFLFCAPHFYNNVPFSFILLETQCVSISAESCLLSILQNSWPSPLKIFSCLIFWSFLSSGTPEIYVKIFRSIFRIFWSFLFFFSLIVHGILRATPWDLFFQFIDSFLSCIKSLCTITTKFFILIIILLHFKKFHVVVCCCCFLSL